MVAYLPVWRNGYHRAVAPETRTKLLDAAAKVFAEKGYDGTSMDDIAGEAGMTKGALYWNFDSKEALFHALLEERLYAPLRGLVEYTRDAEPEASTAQRGSAVMAAIQTNPGLVAIGYERWLQAFRDEAKRGEQADLWRTMRDALADALKTRAQHLGAPAFDVPPERVATMYIGLAHGMAMWRLIDPSIADDELYGEACVLIYQGLVARALGVLPEDQQAP